MIDDSYNNMGIAALAISSVLGHFQQSEIAKLVLILPIVMHRDSLTYLAKSNSSVTSFTNFIYSRPSNVTNFPQRFDSSLSTSLNAIQLLSEIGAINILDQNVKFIRPLRDIAKMGRRAEKIAKASKNIANILNAPSTDLYLNFRIQL